MLYCLMGESASGKTTIEEELYKLGNVDKIISYTSRPMREGEVNGYHYHFVDKEQFESMLRENFFTEYKMFRGWYYGTNLDEIDFVNQDYVIVCTPSGFRTYIDKFGRDYIRGIYIYTQERDRLIRQLKRGDDIDEIFRRLKTDRKDFKYIHELYDVIFDNTFKSAQATAQYINRYMETNKAGVIQHE